MESTTRAALGSSASLGDLYDARRDDFTGLSIFRRAIPAAAVTLRDSPFSDIKLLHSDDYSGKFTKLDVNAELQVSVLGGLLRLEGSGQYLSDQKKSARTVKSSLIYNIKTKEESLNIYHEQLKNAFIVDAINTGTATHVVVGISWGANSILTCQFENRENKDIIEIGGKMNAEMERLKLGISGNARVDFRDNDGANGLNIDVRMFGDVVATNDDLPTTAEAALQLMKRMPSLVSSANDGKGKPLSYRLLPIKTLKSYLKFSLEVDVVIKSLEESSLTRIVQFFDQISNAKQKLYDFHQDVSDFKYCIEPEDYRKIINLEGKVEVEESKMRSELASLLTDVRSGRKDVAKMEELLLSFQKSEFSPQNVETIFETWTSVIQKINFARTLAQNKVKYIGIGTSFDEELVRIYEHEILVLYFSQASGTEDPEKWQGNKTIFINAIKRTPNKQKYLAVDCGIHPDLKKSESSLLQVLKDGQIISEDLFEEDQFFRNNALVKTTSQVEKILYKPNKRVQLSIKCVGDTCDPDKEHRWICCKCKKDAEYGFDRFVYCSCGKAPALSLDFKCPDPRHGLTFKRHSPQHLQNLLDAMRPYKELNILILGETGVGKSTWINSFVNYLNYETLEEAANGELISLIPTSFTLLNANYEEVVVRTGGHDDNEVQAAGQSATQSSKVYPFNIGDTIVRLIDTPGMGDTRGVPQDRQNFENILGTLSYHDEIHGICILLKPNNAKLSVTFRYCVIELLTYLHKDASKNIVFCFTNSRGTFYMPGDTYRPLSQLLLENNVDLRLVERTTYCYDSESFRFLAAIKNDPPVFFNDGVRQAFNASWEKSMSEAKRMLDHIKTLPPHKTQDMLSLNFARKLVLQLSRPLADITRNIQLNKAIVLDEIKDIEEMEERMDELLPKIMMKRTTVKNTRIDYPKTVCTDVACIEMHSLGDQGQQVAFYKQQCHSHCYLTGVGEDLIGDVKLLGCAAMNSDGVCKHCNHRYTVHAHFWYDSTLVETQVVDQSIIDSLRNKESAAQMKRGMIKQRQMEVEEYEYELKEIEKASVKFAHFLKKNAMTAYNDATEVCLDHHIREERDKLTLAPNRSRATLEGLVESLESYRKERDILNREMERESGREQPLTALDVTNLIARLKRLPRYGQTLADALDAVQSTQRVVYNEVSHNAEPRQAPKNKTWLQRFFAQ